jgi:hypothetical protein
MAELLALLGGHLLPSLVELPPQSGAAIIPMAAKASKQNPA